MKKKYMKPEMQVYNINPTTLLAASPGEKYDQIDTSDEYCTKPE